MRRYENLMWPWIYRNHLSDNILTFPRYSIKRKRGIEPFVLNVLGATTNDIVGANSNSEDSSQVKAKTRSSSGTPTSPTNGVTLTIRYQASNNDTHTKIFKVAAEEAYDFLSELNEGAPFPALCSQEQTIVFPADKIYEIRVEAQDVPEGSEGEGEKASELGGGETT